MEYFIMRVGKEYVPPHPAGFYGKIDKKTISSGNRNTMQNNLIIDVEKNMQMVYTDIVVFPSFMVSEKVRKIIELYQKGISYKRVIYCDQGWNNIMEYYILFLDEIDCLSEESKGKISRNIFENIEVDGNAVKNHCIFKAGGIFSDCVLVRMDLLESMLRRGTVGIDVFETKVKYGDD